MADIVIGDYFTLSEKMGSGSFGEVYAGKDSRTGGNVAIKLESIDTRFPQLASEAESYRMLDGGEGIPKLHYFAQQGDYLVMIIDLLGPDLYHCHTEEKFTKDQVFDIGAQLMKRMEFIHARGLIYRDVKPENFLFGLYSKAEMVHVIDYGLAKGPMLINGMSHSDRPRDPSNLPAKKDGGLHVPLRPDHNQLIGTARYASIAAHTGLELIWRDDLESIGYMLIFFLAGPLPWQGMKAPKGEVQAMYDNIGAVKQRTSLEDLCKPCPEEIYTFMKYVRGLNYTDRPDYTYLRHLFAPPKKGVLSDDIKQQMASMTLTSTGSSPRSTMSVTRKISTLPEIFNRLSAAFGFKGASSPPTVVTGLPPGANSQSKLTSPPPAPPERMLVPSKEQQHNDHHGHGGGASQSPPPPPPPAANHYNSQSLSHNSATHGHTASGHHGGGGHAHAPSHSHSHSHHTVPNPVTSSPGGGAHGHHHSSNSMHHVPSPHTSHHQPHSVSVVPSPPQGGARRSKDGGGPPRLSKSNTSPLQPLTQSLIVGGGAGVGGAGLGSGSHGVAHKDHANNSNSNSNNANSAADSEAAAAPAQMYSPMRNKPLPRPAGASASRNNNNTTGKDGRYALASAGSGVSTMTNFELTRGREKERQKAQQATAAAHPRAKTPPATRRAPTPPRGSPAQPPPIPGRGASPGPAARPPPTPATIVGGGAGAGGGAHAPSISRAASEKSVDARARSTSPSGARKTRTRSDPYNEEEGFREDEAKRPAGGKIQNLFRFS